VMAPMVATVEEARWFIDRARVAGIPPDVELGVMVEVPSLVLAAEEVARHVAFLSIGTNDLTQYLHAADRRNPNLGTLSNPFNPAVLRAIDLVCRGAAGRCWVGVCGEAASDPGWALLAVGLGVTELSMQAVAIPGVRAAIRGATLHACKDAAERALRTIDPDEARAIAYELIEEQP
jgi:phosphoenolpyruvate-protein phosphotransferase (PTS system enzyme I)